MAKPFLFTSFGWKSQFEAASVGWNPGLLNWSYCIIFLVLDMQARRGSNHMTCAMCGEQPAGFQPEDRLWPIDLREFGLRGWYDRLRIPSDGRSAVLMPKVDGWAGLVWIVGGTAWSSVLSVQHLCLECGSFLFLSLFFFFFFLGHPFESEIPTHNPATCLMLWFANATSAWLLWADLQTSFFLPHSSARRVRAHWMLSCGHAVYSRKPSDLRKTRMRL